ncbi:MAG: 4-alpha-glucanotransferase, partial [Nitrospinales bacterium]
KLYQSKRPYVVAGVPPDYFSQTGQLWGNPVYNWNALQEREYDWWIWRIEHNLNCFDWVRIDHFRGLVAYWEVPVSEESAVNGQWETAPAMDFFATVLKKIPGASIIAEDLGYITPDVREVMERFNFTGMKLLVFGLEGNLPANPYAPHRHIQNCVLYTGNHDCNTVRGWFENDLSPEDKDQLFRYLGRKLSAQEISWELVRLAMMSVANTAILPAQDILGLGEEARLNRPATTTGNWQWRLLPECLDPALAQRLLEITELYGRA